jgi:hypothetical protein
MARTRPATAAEQPLDPAVIALVQALARAQAREDHDREQRDRKETAPS